MRRFSPRLRAAVFVFALLPLACAPAPRRPAGREVVDDLGRAVRVPSRIDRVVTLAPNLTEIVFAVGGGEKLAGTDDFSNHPPDARRLPKVGGMHPDLEKVVALDPDLVLASTEGNQPGIGPALAAAGVPLYVVRTDRLDEIPLSLARVGELLGTGNGETAASTLRDQIRRQLRRRPRQPRVLFAVWADPLYVAGRDTFTDDLFALTGARNAAGAKGWAQLSHEALLANVPDIILHPGATVSRTMVERLFAAAPSVLRRVEIVAVDDDRFTRPGPRVAEAAAALNEIIDQWAAR
ncbi:MAG TPA: helical backbone metal receptor [Thermoanaerobaculia bacterium]|nr:helical backbone metal receptor [Thermoanaerobaculia bacterium]